MEEATPELQVAEWLKKSGQTLRRRLRGGDQGIDRRVPDAVYDDDVYLVSYPRSGNTWARFMLANLIWPADSAVTFQTVVHILPDLHTDRPQIEALPRPRLIKSHAPLERRYPRTIYLARDGRDVYVSYYHYRREKLPEGTTLADYLPLDHWPCSWGEHVSGWLDAGLPEERFLLVRYEQLAEQPDRELARMAAFAGIEATEAEIAAAVQKSTFDSMRRIEDRSGHPRAGHFSGHFVRSGKVGGWQEHFGPQERAAFKALGHDNQALVRLGYESSSDW